MLPYSLGTLETTPEEKSLRETKGYPAAGSVGLATDQQGAEDITSRERVEESASVIRGTGRRSATPAPSGHQPREAGLEESTTPVWRTAG